MTKHKHRISNTNDLPPLGFINETWNREMEEIKKYFDRMVKRGLLKWYERL